MEPPDNGQRLEDSVVAFVNKKVSARPINGWGWSEGYGWRRILFGSDEPNSVTVPVPSPFSFELAEFFDWNDQRRGGIGRIKESGHIYDGWWLLFHLNFAGCYDFVQNIGHYVFKIGQQRPLLYPPSYNPTWAKHWPLIYFPDIPAVHGYGQLGASRNTIDEFNKKRLAEAKGWKESPI